MRAKFFYYCKATLQFLYPFFLCRLELNSIIKRASNRPDFEYILKRVEYYNKLDNKALNKSIIVEKSIKENSIDTTEISIRDFRWKSKKWFSVYYCDTLEYIRYFPLHLKFNYFFGDIKTTPSIPTIVKARPLHEENMCSVILKLNKYRHFNFIHDKLPFSKKEDKLIFYSALTTLPYRKKFMQMYFNHPMCICRCFKKSDKVPSEWNAPKISIKDHLKYKFVLALEGNDVATCLKWVMSSNSIAVMPKPTCESWFMEGTLIPNYHYIEIKRDFTDLIDKLNYYIFNISEAEQIVKNANEHVKLFLDKEREKMISLIVLKKYFENNTF